MEKNIEKYIKQGLEALYSIDTTNIDIPIEKTKEEIKGDFTVVVFAFSKFSKKSPADTAKDLGTFIRQKYEDVSSYNVINGFLNLRMTNEYWINRLNNLNTQTSEYELVEKETIMVEFSSPNTNKPLHLGHIRNNLLGDSISKILQASGKNVIKTNLINDRGIHICKSILAWIKWGNDETPETNNKKGDKLVGEYYVKFETKYKEEINELISKGENKEYAKANAPIILEAREILRKWENGDKEIIKIWQMMNSWVYKGFDKTYSDLGISFDKIYYESDTYLLGKKIVNKELDKGIFVKDEDNSVWIDLSNEGLDRKILLRSDGTTVYMTQDIGTAIKRIEEEQPEKIIYVVGNEQDYHFAVLKKIISKINKSYSEIIQHLSYGMVELPEGKMKSREGIVVDADDLLNDMILTAKKISEESGKTHDLDENEKEKIIKMIALGALKYFIIKVDPKKQMVFNPKESIDFNGNTGPFIQYTHARIKSILRNADKMNIKFSGKASQDAEIVDLEIELISHLCDFEKTIQESARKLDPSLIANYVFALTKLFNQYYHEHSILKETEAKTLQFRLLLAKNIAGTIKSAMKLLGIEVPEIM